METLFEERKSKTDTILYLLILLLVLILRYLVLLRFGFKYTDSDQVVMWLGLKDYSAGIFHEPRFYGQSYNSMMESFFAIPLYKAGLPASKAIPIVTSVFAVIPFIIISLFTFFKQSKKTALLIISIPLLLPVEYSLITTMPRGFVTGVFISSLGCISIFYPKSKWSFLLSALAAVIAYSLNSNSVLLSFAYLFILFLENYKNKKFYLYTLAGVVIGIVIHLMFTYFYVLHPEYDFHKMWDIAFSFETIINSLFQLDIYFNHIMPIFWDTGFLILFFFIIISGFLFAKKEYLKAITTGLIPLIIILTLGVNKVHDGYESVFFSYARMHLAIPVLLGFCLCFLKISERPYIKYTLYLYLVIPAVFFIYQISILDKKITEDTKESSKHIVSVIEVDRLKERCNNLKNVCIKYKIDLVVFSDFERSDCYNYGCPSCTDNFPKTLHPSYDRRAWRLLEDEQTVYKNILIIDSHRDFSKEYGFVKRINDEPNFYIIENNTIKTMRLFSITNIFVREYD